MALDHCTVLVITVAAAALSVAALLGADCVTAAVVAEGTPTQSGNRHFMRNADYQRAEKTYGEVTK